MTTRFTRDYNGDEHLRTHFLDNGKPLTKKEVVDLLNELHEENQQLKKREHEIKNIIDNLEKKD